MQLRSVRNLALGLITITPLLAMTGWDSEAADRRVRINNNTSRTLTHLYASNVDRGTWEEDILGRSVVPSGQSVRANIDDGSGYCLYDLKAVFRDGSVVTRYRANVCTLERWTISD
jgi:hypothetical protein